MNIEGIVRDTVLKEINLISRKAEEDFALWKFDTRSFYDFLLNTDLHVNILI